MLSPCRVDVGSILGRCLVDVGSTLGRIWVDVGSMLGRGWVEFGSFLMFCCSNLMRSQFCYALGFVDCVCPFYFALRSILRS